MDTCDQVHVDWCFHKRWMRSKTWNLKNQTDECNKYSKHPQLADLLHNWLISKLTKCHCLFEGILSLAENLLPALTVCMQFLSLSFSHLALPGEHIFSISFKNVITHTHRQKASVKQSWPFGHYKWCQQHNGCQICVDKLNTTTSKSFSWVRPTNEEKWAE